MSNTPNRAGAYQIDADSHLVHAFQQAHTAVAGSPLPLGAKPFVDDGNIYASLGGIPALTHGPAATGAHTLNEAVPVEELVRVAKVYALTAVAFCGGASARLTLPAPNDHSSPVG